MLLVAGIITFLFILLFVYDYLGSSKIYDSTSEKSTSLTETSRNDKDSKRKFVCERCNLERTKDKDSENPICPDCGREMALGNKRSADVTKDKNDETEHFLNGAIRYSNGVENDRGTRYDIKKIVSKGESVAMEKAYKKFRIYFNGKGIEHSKDKKEMYLPPYVAYLTREESGYLSGKWRTERNSYFGSVEDIVSMSYHLGKEVSEMEPELFLISVGSELWSSGSKKILFRLSTHEGRKEIISSNVVKKNGRAHLPDFRQVDLTASIPENDVTISASNAFWVGAGMNVKHKGPSVKLNLETELVDLGIPGFRSEKRDVSSQGAGSVYVLVNPQIYNLVKIGYTRQDVEDRARQLSGTGVPGNWEVAHETEARRPEHLEEKVHRKLSEQRIQENREFFRVDPEEAARVIEKMQP